MSIILSSSHTAFHNLEKRGVLCITEEEANRADIRPLRIGILNIMPGGEKYEPMLLYSLSRSIIQIEPVWIRLRTHQYKSTNREHLDTFYCSFEEAITRGKIDGLIITGAPVEEIEYEHVRYWNELTDICLFARTNIPSTVGICWGGLALAKMLGIEKKRYEKKLFGIFKTKNLDRSYRVLGDCDDIFLVPQSRHSGIDHDVMEKEAKSGNVHLLAYAEEGGYTIFESGDRKYLMHLGHPEYEAERFILEYRRDVAAGRKDVAPPENIDLENPINQWRSNGLEFFAQWIRNLYGPANRGA